MLSRQVNFVGVLVIFCSAIAGAEYVMYKDPNQPVDARVADLLNRMTLAEKIGQMMQIERRVTTPRVMKDYFIGSVLSGGGSVPAPRASAEDWVDMINGFQMAALSTRLGIPMLYGIDAVHGNNNVYNATIFPHNVGLGATRTRQEDRCCNCSRSQSNRHSLHLRAMHCGEERNSPFSSLQLNLYFSAFVIQTCRDPRWGRCFESYSEDHEIVQAMTDVILGLQGDLPQYHAAGFPYVAGERKVIASAKHFVGDGGTQRGINENDTVIDENELFSIHMPAYYDAIAKGVSTVMISYSSWNGLKMHANHNLITDLLKGKLGFQGFVISDWEGIDRITSPPDANFTYSVQASINAGIDIVMLPFNYFTFSSTLMSLVDKNVVTMSRIDDAVRRILQVKFILGLFEKPLADLSLADQLGKKEHRELAREAVRKSLVLLKNGNSGDDPLLPLPKKAPKVLVTGSHADNLGYQCGGWTIEWMGASGRITVGTTILEAVKSTVDPATTVLFSENPNADYFTTNDNFSYAIVVVGEHPYAETAGDSLNLTIAEPGPSTIEAVCGAVKCVVVLVTGRPVVIEPYITIIDALVAAWLPGSEGQGVADVLFGDYAFTGKLPRTWFRTVDQLPMNTGDANYDPLFPFGFGLSTKPTNREGEISYE